MLMDFVKSLMGSQTNQDTEVSEEQTTQDTSSSGLFSFLNRGKSDATAKQQPAKGGLLSALGKRGTPAQTGMHNPRRNQPFPQPNRMVRNQAMPAMPMRQPPRPRQPMPGPAPFGVRPYPRARFVPPMGQRRDLPPAFMQQRRQQGQPRRSYPIF